MKSHGNKEFELKNQEFEIHLIVEPKLLIVYLPMDLGEKILESILLEYRKFLARHHHKLAVFFLYHVLFYLSGALLKQITCKVE